MTIQSVNLFAPRHRHATYHQLYRSHTPRSQTSADDTPVSSLVPSAVASMEQPVPGELTDELIAVLSITNRELELEAAEVDRAVRILPGVKALLESIPEGHYAVATSGAKTYAHGSLARVGIVQPNVTITADDSRLRGGKPAPDPFPFIQQSLDAGA